MKKPVSSVMVLVLLAVPLLGGLVAIAYAGDLCLTFGAPPALTPPITVVIQDVGGGKEGKVKEINDKLDKANNCKVFPAFFTSPNQFNSGNLIGTATMCTNSAGTGVRVTTNYWGGVLATDFPLPIPTTNGFTDIVSFNSGLGQFLNVPTTAAVCVPPVVPVP
jgi:hypothetical protein